MTSKELQRAKAEEWNRQQQQREAEQLKALQARQRKTQRRLRRLKHATREDQLKVVALLVEAAGLLWVEKGWLEKQLAEVATRIPPSVSEGAEEGEC